MAPRRVVAVCASGEVSGAEKILLGLLELAATDGVEVVVASPPGPLTERLPAGSRHVELPPAGRGGATGRWARTVATARWVVRWPAAVRRLRTEVLRPHTRTVVMSPLVMPVIALARPPDPVWLVVDVVTTREQLLVARLFSSRRGSIVAMTAAAAAPLRDLGRTVAVRPVGVMWPVDPAPRAADGTVQEPPVVGSLSLLTPWKGIDDILAAVALLPGVRLEVAGGHFDQDAGYVAGLRARADEADLAGRVTFLGHVDPHETLRRWDVFVSASTSPEAGPMTVLEAMSVGVPVVATDHGGPTEYLADGAGELVPPGDPAALAAAIERLLADRARRRRLAAGGRRRIADRYDANVALPAQYRAVVGRAVVGRTVVGRAVIGRAVIGDSVT